jgi:tetratricopeptide (TPR) repeat protein
METAKGRSSLVVNIQRSIVADQVGRVEMADIGRRLAAARAARGLDVEGLAVGALSPAYLRAVEAGSEIPDREAVLLIAHRLGEPAAAFVDDAERSRAARVAQAVLAASPPIEEEALAAALRAADVAGDPDLLCEAAVAYGRRLLATERWREAEQVAAAAWTASAATAAPARTAALALVRGDAALALGRPAEAAQFYQEALSRLPADDPAAGEVHRRLADALERQGAYEEAIQFYTRALATAAGPPAAALEAALATCLKALGRVQAAYEHALSAHRRQLPEGGGHRLLGSLALALGRLDEAERWVEDGLRSAARAGDDAEAAELYAILTRVHLARGRRTQARSAWQEGLRRAASGPHARPYAALLALGLQHGFGSASLLREVADVLAVLFPPDA